MLSLLMGLGIAAVSGGASLVAKHLWNKFRASPVEITADAAALALAMKKAAEDKRLTRAELAALASQADDLAKNFK